MPRTRTTTTTNTQALLVLCLLVARKSLATAHTTMNTNIQGPDRHVSARFPKGPRMSKALIVLCPLVFRKGLATTSTKNEHEKQLFSYHGSLWRKHSRFGSYGQRCTVLLYFGTSFEGLKNQNGHARSSLKGRSRSCRSCRKRFCSHRQPTS